MAIVYFESIRWWIVWWSRLKIKDFLLQSGTHVEVFDTLTFKNDPKIWLFALIIVIVGEILSTALWYYSDENLWSFALNILL